MFFLKTNFTFTFICHWPSFRFFWSSICVEPRITTLTFLTSYLKLLLGPCGRKKTVKKLVRGGLPMQNFGCSKFRGHGRITSSSAEKTCCWHLVWHARLNYTFHLIFNNIKRCGRKLFNGLLVSWSRKSELSLILLWKLLSLKEDPRNYFGSVDLHGTLCVLTMTPLGECPCRPREQQLSQPQAVLLCLAIVAVDCGRDALHTASSFNNSLEQTLKKERNVKTLHLLYSTLIILAMTNTVWSSKKS